MFYTIVITDAAAIYPYGSIREAKEKMYHEMEYAANQNIKIVCLIMDINGAIHQNDSFTPNV